MRFVSKLRKSWSAIRWKMLIIFAFFSVISTLLIGCFSVAVLNVVIRRESAYLIEERIYEIVGNRYSLTPALLDRVHECNGPASELNSDDRLHGNRVVGKPNLDYPSDSGSEQSRQAYMARLALLC